MRGLACVPCGKFFRIVKNGFIVEEGMPNERDGTWGPYKLWRADLYICPSCGTKVVTGFAANPFAEHFEDRYKEQAEKYPPQLRVNDCGGCQP